MSIDQGPRETTTQRRRWLDAPREAWTAWLAEQGEPRYRTGQIARWIYQARADRFADMTDLPAALRRRLDEQFVLFPGRVVRRRRDADGTEKLLIQWPDGGRAECVLLREGARRSICISTQVGCAMGCAFCASGLGGLERNLRCGEILEQMLQLQRLLPPDERLTHITVMGMGEPLANLNHLLPALGEATRPDGLGISGRRITISTVGLPEAIRKLAAAAPPYHLAVSLHAAQDGLRNRLVPANRRVGLRRLLEAADAYFAATGRRVTFEYVLLAGVNDDPEAARRLARLLRGRPALINVIPFNPSPQLDFRTPSEEAVARFCRVLRQAGLNVQRRRRRGRGIGAACGQLRAEAC